MEIRLLEALRLVLIWIVLLELPEINFRHCHTVYTSVYIVSPLLSKYSNQGMYWWRWGIQPFRTWSKNSIRDQKHVCHNFQFAEWSFQTAFVLSRDPWTEKKSTSADRYRRSKEPSPNRMIKCTCRPSSPWTQCLSLIYSYVIHYLFILRILAITVSENRAFTHNRPLISLRAPDAM